jgi:uncharacterized protein YggE
VSNIVAPKFHDIPRLGGLLDKGVTAGANSVSSVGFDHTDPSALRLRSPTPSARLTSTPTPQRQDRAADDVDRRARP